MSTTLVTHCHVCGTRLQWPRTTDPYDGVRRHFDYVHPALVFDPSKYEVAR